MLNTALSTNDENNVSLDLTNVSSYSASNIGPSVYNIDNSSDVIIGTVTQIHGPVTIYQNARKPNQSIENELDNITIESQKGKLVKSESTSSDVHHPSDKSDKHTANGHKTKFIGGLLLILIIIIIVIAIIIVSLKSSPSTPSNYDYEVYNDSQLVPLGKNVILKKEVWGGRDAVYATVPLKHPVQFVIISHTATPTCSTFKLCSDRVQSIQTFHVETLGSPDIGYNFVIGGDGNAYVGRGWDVKNFHSNNSIGISFIGNFVYDYLTADMMNMTKKLLDIGVKSGKLSKTYALIAHNQTYATSSPGSHVYEVIKSWPHFDSSTFITP